MGGTRGHTLTIGGADCMPFHLWEGRMPNRPLVAMEVFDVISEKYPAVLEKHLWQSPEPAGGNGPGLCGTIRRRSHQRAARRNPSRKGNRTPDEAVSLVKAVLAAVEVPLIVTGHSHYEKNNEVLKSIAQACAGENLLLNWVEQDNYRTIAGAAIAYGHCVVSQSPIDVNIAKQLNILLTNMDVKPERIVMDPMTGATGYGLEYTCSVMERIRLTGLGGDRMLGCPDDRLSGAGECQAQGIPGRGGRFPGLGKSGKTRRPLGVLRGLEPSVRRRRSADHVPSRSSDGAEKGDS